MSERLQIFCASGEEISNSAFLRENATWEQNILLVFSKNNLDDSAKYWLIAGLYSVPPDHYVSNLGSSTLEDENWVAISRVVSEGYILENHEAVVGAARAFRRTATLLMERVAVHFRVPLSSLFEWHTFAAMQTGRLDDPWLFASTGSSAECITRRQGKLWKLRSGSAKSSGF